MAFENVMGKMEHTITVVEKLEFLFDPLSGLEEEKEEKGGEGDAKKEDDKDQTEDSHNKSPSQFFTMRTRRCELLRKEIGRMGRNLMGRMRSLRSC